MSAKKAILVPVGGKPHSIEIEGLSDLQSAVGGWIESASWVFDDEPAMYVNEEGKFTCLPNRAVYARPEDAGRLTWDGKAIAEGDVLDIIFGDFVCIGFDPETGEDRDISDEETARVMERFGAPGDIRSGEREVLRIRSRDK